MQAADATATAALRATQQKASGEYPPASEFRLLDESYWNPDAAVCETDAAGPRPEPGAGTALPGLPVSIMSVTAVPAAADGPEADSSAHEAVTNAATQPSAEKISTTTGNQPQPTALSAQVSTITAAVPQSSNSTASTLQNAGETSCNAQVLKALVEEWTPYNEVDSMSDDHLANWVTLCSSIRPCAEGTTLSLTASDAAAFTKSLCKARAPSSQRGGNNVKYMHHLRKAAIAAHETGKGPALPQHLYDLLLPGSNGATTPSEYTIVEKPGMLLHWMYGPMRGGAPKQVKLIMAAVNVSRGELLEHERADWTAKGLGVISGDTVVAPGPNDPSAPRLGLKWTRGFAAQLAALSQGVRSERAFPRDLKLGNIIAVSIPEAWAIVVLMACYNTREPLEHRFKPKHYRTCVHKTYTHVLKNYHRLVFEVASDVNTGSYTLQEGGYPCCTETNKHLERDDLTAQLDTIRKEALQEIIQKHVKKQSYCPAVRLLEKKYFMFERSSPRFTDATSKETALTLLVLASEFAFTNDWEEWVIPAMKSTVRRDCTEHFCAITQQVVRTWARTR